MTKNLIIYLLFKKRTELLEWQYQESGKRQYRESG